jgi:hypothetical protein
MDSTKNGKKKKKNFKIVYEKLYNFPPLQIIPGVLKFSSNPVWQKNAIITIYSTSVVLCVCVCVCILMN